MSDPRLIPPAPKTTLPDPIEADSVIYNPSPDRLLALSREFETGTETETEFGSLAHVTEQRSRCADRTKNAVDDAFDATDHAHIETALQCARERKTICLDRRIARHPDHSYVGRYYVPTRYARIALTMTNLFEPAERGVDPDFVTVQIPDHDEIAIRVLPDTGVTAVLGSDYSGEAKKSFLRLFMRRVKERGGLGIHAGSKRVTLHTDEDGLEDVGQVFLGLSATGKSTLTAHGLWLEEPESATMLQDDICALLPDGTVAGSEGNGLYVKTIGLSADEQPETYAAATHESAVLENVAVTGDGTVDFDSDEHTANGRAAILREHLTSADNGIDLDTVDQVFFITRNPVMPPVAKLSTTEAAAAFMLGESVQTSAGDPESAGESIRVVGTNPFITGPEGAEGNRFRELISDLDADCFVLNTGYLGERAKDIGVEESVTLLREIARGTVEWTDSEETGLTVPRSVPGMDIDEFAVPDHVENYETKLRELRADRAEYLSEFEELDESIEDAVY
ncbi:phosphoenolpyruvate carboxykinase (ATP) [Natronomonas sp.]|uniref:phosphoenolpyruvate carboxykinase (ATP) n=1 Tax=Natronomonas sp. TaxID=2184060 RepID=UPI00263075D0|nr:phosphoenolpyruvate carboxykinase (ATP) [Natronomonas sp.]